jgi:hypothetical protein
MANYMVDPAMLADRIPSGTEIDLHEGRCFISLVGFMFLDTRVKNFLVPGHVNFEEVNLRFYVRRKTGDEVRRGVVFIKEIVPRWAIAVVARRIYGEPYERWEMSNFRDERHVRYSWEMNTCRNSISVGRGGDLGVPSAGSHEEFIIEHYWGYTKRGNERTDEYKVEHPKWALFDPIEPRIKVDFGGVYGDTFANLSGREPDSVLLAAGSEISVFRGEKII